MKVVIAGGRDFVNFKILENCLKELQERFPIQITEVVSGHAQGADCLGERYQFNHGLKLKLFRADWKTYGKAAGPIRNKQMADYADAVVLFWDGKSRGTKNMYDNSNKSGLPVIVFDYEGNQVLSNNLPVKQLELDN